MRKCWMHPRNATTALLLSSAERSKQVPPPPLRLPSVAKLSRFLLSTVVLLLSTFHSGLTMPRSSELVVPDTPIQF